MRRIEEGEKKIEEERERIKKLSELCMQIL